MENRIILPYWLRCRWRLKSYIKSVAVEIDFSCIYSIQKSEGEKGGVGVGGRLFQRGRIFEKNVPGNG